MFRPAHLERAFPDRDVVTRWRETECGKEGSGKGKVLESEGTSCPDCELAHATRVNMPMLVEGRECTYPDHAVVGCCIVHTDAVLALVTFCEDEVVAVGAECVAWRR